MIHIKNPHYREVAIVSFVIFLIGVAVIGFNYDVGYVLLCIQALGFFWIAVNLYIQFGIEQLRNHGL